MGSQGEGSGLFSTMPHSSGLLAKGVPRVDSSPKPSSRAMNSRLIFLTLPHRPLSTWGRLCHSSAEPEPR